MKTCYIFLFIPFACLVCQNRTQFHLAFSQGSVNNWREGSRSTLDVSAGVESRIRLDVAVFTFTQATRIAFGIQRLRLSDSTGVLLLPTENELSVEWMFGYPVHWKVDPYIAVQLQTQLTHAFLLLPAGLQSTAAFWDPVVSRESIGFSFLCDRHANSWNMRGGVALNQIRAKQFTSRTDNPSTPCIHESYRAEAGVELVIESEFAADSGLVIRARVNCLRSLVPDRQWVIVWDTELQQQFWRWLGLLLRLQLSYDYPRSSGIQYQQSVRIGIVASL